MTQQVTKKCLNCGEELPEEYIIEQQLQKEKEEFTAERPFLSTSDFVAKHRSIKLLEMKKTAVKTGYCSIECMCKHPPSEVMYNPQKDDGSEPLGNIPEDFTYEDNAYATE